MGQYWYLISIDKGQYTCVGKLAEAIPNGEVSSLPFMIVKPSYNSFCCQFPSDQSELEDNKNDLNSLLSLPWELLSSSLDQMDLTSVLCWALTCRRAWRMGWPLIQCIIVGPWWNTRLICEGDENAAARVPPDMLCAEELELLASGLDESELEGERYRPGPVKLSTFMRARGLEIDMDRSVGLRVREMLSCNLPQDEYRAALAFVHGFDNGSVFSTGDWVLRNTTIHSIILGRKLNAAFHPTRRTSGVSLPYPGFGEVILAQVSYSSSASASIGFNRGSWAGHRLELVTDKEHELESDQTWVDDSDAVINRLAGILGLHASSRLTL